MKAQRTGDVRWTQAEDAILVPAYKAGGVMAALAALPHRRKAQIDGRLKHLGVRRYPPWTARRNEELRRLWGHATLGQIAQRLDCKPITVYRHALALDLGVCPQGFEYIATAAERLGYSADTFTRICRWAGVGMPPSYQKPGRASKHPRHMVDSADAEAAIDRWHTTETLTSAAERLGFGDYRALLDRLQALGHRIVEKGEGRYRNPMLEEPGPTSSVVRVGTTARGRKEHRDGFHIRVDSALADRAAALENMKEAAQRTGIFVERLKGILLAAGVRPATKRGYLLEPAFVDKVVADSRLPSGTESVAEAAGVNKLTMSRWLRAAGFTREGNAYWRLHPAEVDVVIEKNLARLAARRVPGRGMRRAA